MKKITSWISLLSKTLKRMDSFKSSICWIVLLFISEVSASAKSLSSHRISETNKIPWDFLLDPNHRKPSSNQTSRFSYYSPTNLHPSYYSINPTEHHKVTSQNQKVKFPTEVNSKIHPTYTNVATFRPKQKATQFPTKQYFNQQEKQGKRRRGDRRKSEKRKPVDSGETFFPDYDDFESVNQHNFGYPQQFIPSASDSEDYFTKAKDFIKLGSYGKPSYSSPDISDDGYGYPLHHHAPDYSEEISFPYKVNHPSKPSKPSKYVAFALGLLPLGLLLASLVPTIVTIPVSTAVATGRRKKRSDCMDKNLEKIIRGFC